MASNAGYLSPSAYTSAAVKVLKIISKMKAEIWGQVEGYSNVYDGNSMLFMDFRRHHSGVWAGTAPRCGPPAVPAAHAGSLSIAKGQGRSGHANVQRAVHFLGVSHWEHGKS